MWHSSRSRPHDVATHRRASSTSLYEPLDFVQVRAPLLPVEAYVALGTGVAASEGCDNQSRTSHGSGAGGAVDLALRDPQVRRALAVGSSALLDALDRSERTPLSGRDARRLSAKLLRYAIRMSTRPTPFGLFAGVALARWGPTTDLALANVPGRTRTRPDMSWLLTLVFDLESRPEIRRRLRLVANPMGVIRGDRVVLAERAPTGRPDSTTGVSVRATGVVRRALALTREPTPYERVVASLCDATAGATRDAVETLLAQLLEQTFLLTDLRPPLTTDSPARYVAERLAEIPTADGVLARLRSVLSAAASWDTLPAEESIATYRRLIAQAMSVSPVTSDTPFQVDMALALQGRHIARPVADEAARAAELLLRLTPLPRGLPYLAAYRQAFESRYGHEREVPLLDVLDPSLGLGVPWSYASSHTPAIPAAASALRAQTLLGLAYRALHDRTRVIELNAEMIERLQTWSPSPETAPQSLDVNVFVAAASSAAVDAGQFNLVIGPNLGASAAGRNLGRFSDLLADEATVCLERAARAEEAHGPGQVWAELVYLPSQLRSANVAIRPAIRSHEIVLAATSGVPPARSIRLDELVVGVRDGRFFVRWPAQDAEVRPCTGHMLNSLRAPAPCRFLSEVSRDGLAHFAAFDWGPASGFPFLPRVTVGRIVLRPAQWRIDAVAGTLELPPHESSAFRQALERWRATWHVPRHVCLSAGDNRLILDLEDGGQSEELRDEIRRLAGRGSVVLQEVLPALDECWTPGPGGHFVTELVVSLALRGARTSARTPVAAAVGASRPAAPARTAVPAPIPMAERLRPPGSDWLFVKLYCPRLVEDDLIAGRVRELADAAVSAGSADEWFFVRYSDRTPIFGCAFAARLTASPLSSYPPSAIGEPG